MTEYEKTIEMVLDVIKEMKETYDYDNHTLDELAQRIV